MKSFLASLFLFAAAALAHAQTASPFAGNYSGGYYPTECPNGYITSSGSFTANIDAYGVINGSYRSEDGAAGVFAGKVNAKGKFKAKTTEGVFAKGIITLDGQIIASAKKNKCKVAVTGSRG